MKTIELMMITNIPEIAHFIETCGVGRIFLDQETLGKEQRQKNLNLPSHIHTSEDIQAVKKSLKSAKVMVRVNPINSNSKVEIDQAIDAGADVVMLPYFHKESEVESFLKIVDGRVTTNILLETAAAAARAEQILSLQGIDEVHFGLNDLRISLNHDFLFESFSGGLIEHLSNVAKKHQISFGIGGVGRVGREMLDAGLIIREHVRLGSERVILSRVFHGESKTLDELNAYADFQSEINKLRAVESHALQRSQIEAEADRIEFCHSVKKVTDIVRSKIA